MKLLVRQILHVNREARKIGVELLMEHARSFGQAVGEMGDSYLRERVSLRRPGVLELSLDRYVEVDSDTPFTDARVDESALEDWQDRVDRLGLHAETETWIEAERDD